MVVQPKHWAGGDQAFVVGAAVKQGTGTVLDWEMLGGVGGGLAELNQAETCVEGRRDGRRGGRSGSDSSRGRAMGRGWSSSEW